MTLVPVTYCPTEDKLSLFHGGRWHSGPASILSGQPTVAEVLETWSGERTDSGEARP